LKRSPNVVLFKIILIESTKKDYFGSNFSGLTSIAKTQQFCILHAAKHSIGIKHVNGLSGLTSIAKTQQFCILHAAKHNIEIKHVNGHN